MGIDTEAITVKGNKLFGISMSKTITDEEFTTLVKGYEVVLYKMAFQYVRNEHDALEMVSETVFKGYKSRKSLKHSEYFRTWITKILIGTCLNFLKRSKRVTFSGDEAIECADSHSFANSLEDSMMLDEALSHLKHEYKTVMLLRYYQDLSVKETSKVMGIPENTVKTYTNRAIAQLRKYLKEDVFYE